MDDLIKDPGLKDKFEQIMGKVPVFLREVARRRVAERLKTILHKDNRAEATEKDIVDAFFLETPFGFHGPLKTDMQSAGIDYTKYGYNQ